MTSAKQKTSLILAISFLCGISACRPESADHASAGSHRPTATGPSVLLISIDTLRRDHLHCYGYPRDTSPNIDRLAAEGVLFENNISSTSWTLPAHAALFTSLPDSVHGCVETDRRLDQSLVTLAERFKAAGYQTVGFFSGPYLHPAFGLGQGFDLYKNCTSYHELLDQAPVGQWAMDPAVMRRSHRDITNPIVFSAVHQWLKSRTETPFFMFIHLWDVHFDFIPPEPYRSQFDPDYHGKVTGENFFFDRRINPKMPKRDLEHLIALYDGEIAWTDIYVGKILDDLKSAGLLDDMVVALTSDHGTEFFEHGGKGHRMTLFDEVLRTPLIIRDPKRLKAGRRVRQQSRIIDIGPTLLELAGLPRAEEILGHSLVPLAMDGSLDFDNTAVSELFSVGRRMRTVRTLDWKLYDNIALNRTYYYKLSEDPGELQGIGDLSTAQGRKMMSAYRRKIEQLKAAAALHRTIPASPSLPAEVSRQLKSLGYVGDEP